MFTGWKKEIGEDRKNTSSLLNQEGEEVKKKHGRVQEEVERWNQGSLANQQAAEEARCKKEQLLAKMLEIDRQNQGAQDFMCAEPIKGSTNQFSPHPPEQPNHNSSVFNLTEPEESVGLHTGAGSREGGRRRLGVEGGAVNCGIGRRGIRTQISSDDLAFGSYAPSFVHSASRGSSGHPPLPPKDDRESALETIGVFSLRGVETETEGESEKGAEKDRKSSLMQQLFGALSMPAGESINSSNKTEVLGSPPTTNKVRSRRDGALNYSSGSSGSPMSSLGTLHVAESRPAIRAIASFDEDIEELTL